MPQKPQRQEFLDSIRGLAALAVLLSHTLQVFVWPHFAHVCNYPFINIPFNGGEAVSMFFVLSGYLLSRPYIAPRPPGGALRTLYLPTFYIRRFTRIWMPWAFVFIFSALAQAFLFRTWATIPPQTDWFQGFWHTPLTLENTLRQAVFISEDTAVQLIMQDWSLRLELQVSLLLPLVLFLHVSWHRWILPALAIPAFLFEPTGCYFAFMVGIFFAKHGDALLLHWNPKPLPAKIGLLALGLIYYEMPHFTTWLPNHFGYRWADPEVIRYERGATGVGCFFILLASMSSRRIRDTLHLPPLVFLGRISYSVYLLQFIVLLCAVPPLVQLLNSCGIRQVVWLLPVIFTTSVALTVGLSAVTYHCIEKPCMELGHWLSAKWKKRAAIT
jgi:peptidoglycan/LPS O-acetylase OafA/YrhL